MLHLDLLPFMKFMISYLEKWKQTQHHIYASLLYSLHINSKFGLWNE